MTVTERLLSIRHRLAEAERRAGRGSGRVRLIGVCKRQPPARVFEAHQAGCNELGESTAQGLVATQRQLESRGLGVRWHFVGALQKNKINHVLPYIEWIHSVDRLELAQALSKRVTRDRPERPLRLLVQVNIGREPKKAGVEPERAVDFACEVANLRGLKLEGLMALPPADEPPEPYFEQLRGLSDSLKQTSEGHHARELSMGMSGDFEAAVECGATMIRIGQALFGPRGMCREATHKENV